MPTKNVTIRIDETLKKRAEIIFESMGLNMSSALQLFIYQTVSKGNIPFSIDAEDSAVYRAYVLRELAESKKEAQNPDCGLQDHDTFLLEWEAKRKARHNGIQNQKT